MRAWLTSAIVLLLIALVVSSSIRRSGEKPISKDEQKAKVKAPEIDEIHPTLADITNSSVAFFDAQGKPLVGFVDKGTNGITLFSSPKGASGRGDEIEPVTRGKVDAYTKMLQERLDAAKRAEEAVQAKEREEKRVAELKKIEAEGERKRVAESNAVAQAKAEEDAKRVAESNAVVQTRSELAKYRDRYISTVETTFDHAVLIVDEEDNLNMSLSSVIADALRLKGKRTTISFFKPAFVKDGLFTSAFLGQVDVLNRLAITNSEKSFILGRQSVSYTSNPQLSDVVTAAMTVKVNAASGNMRPISAQTLQSTGAGFTKEEARRMAEERIAVQLTNGVIGKIEKSMLP